MRANQENTMNSSVSAPLQAGSPVKPLEGHRMALTLLVLAFTLSITDRMILSILFPDIKAEFGLLDYQLGLLGGLSFAMFYATLGLPIARLADRYSRKVIIITSLIIFSLMTTLSGWAAGFISLLILRIGVGVGEAGILPSSHSIVADYIPAHRRAFAMATLMLGANIGMILGFAGGGVIAENYGWRAALISVGLPGIFLGIVMIWLLKEPPRGSFEAKSESNNATPPPPILTTARFMWKTPAMRQLVAGSTVTGMLIYGLTQWVPTFFIRVHDFGQTEVGIMMALLFGILGAIGALISGKLTDRYATKGLQYGIWIVSGAMALAVPFWFAAFTAESFSLTILFLLIPAFTASFHLGPSLALIQTLSPIPMRAVSSAINMFCLNLIGMGLGPLTLGLLSDILTPLYGDSGIQIALASFSILGLWGAIHFVLCGKALAKHQSGTYHGVNTTS